MLNTNIAREIYIYIFYCFPKDNSIPWPKQRKYAKDMTNFYLQQDCITKMFNPRAFFFLPFVGATWYYNAIYKISTQFAPFTSYEVDIFQGISNLYIQRSKVGRKLRKKWRKILIKLDPVGLVGFAFSNTGPKGKASSYDKYLWCLLLVSLLLQDDC